MGKDVGCIARRYDLARQEKWRRDASATAGSSAKGNGRPSAAARKKQIIGAACLGLARARLASLRPPLRRKRDAPHGRRNGLPSRRLPCDTNAKLRLDRRAASGRRPGRIDPPRRESPAPEHARARERLPANRQRDGAPCPTCVSLTARASLPLNSLGRSFVDRAPVQP